MKAISEVFDDFSVTGTIYISDLEGKQEFCHNIDRAASRYASASTFKILNSLIALEERVIQSLDDICPWNGVVDDRFPEWSQDQTMRTAFKYSCVWFYQGIARKVGLSTYRRYITATEFGELVEPCETDTFWLVGKLRVSAIEQVRFLKKIFTKSLSFSDRAYDGLATIMLADQGVDYKLFGKTGWAARVTPQVGWYVGYIIKNEKPWFFATNIQVDCESQLPLRIEITRRALSTIGVLHQ